MTEFEAMVTDEGNWLFNPQMTLERASAEAWGILPPAAQSGRVSPR